MKRFFTCIFAIILLSGCKKTVEKIKEDRVISAMTSGQWVIANFIENGNDITPGFSGYSFQYHGNRTVDAIKNGAVERSGTWDGDVAAMTTWANFSNAVTPLALLNGTWHIDDNSWTFVVLSQADGTGKKKMRLEKL